MTSVTPRPVTTGRRVPTTGPATGPVVRLVTRRPKSVLITALLIAVAAIVFSGDLVGALKTGGFDDPSSESVRGQKSLAQHFHAADPNLVVMLEKPGGDVDDPDVRTVADQVTQRLTGTEGVSVVGSYWAGRAPQLAGRDRDKGIILARVDGDEDTSAARVKDLHELAGHTGAVTVGFGGITQVNNDINAQVTEDLARAEAIAVPITLILLLLVFGTVWAAGAPLLIGLFSIVATLGTLRLLAVFTDVSVFAVNMATALGLGLAVDYSLLFVSRYREQRLRDPDNITALAATMRTAGSTVVFSAATVAVALCSLLVFPQYFLRSFAYAGIAVVIATVCAALMVLPALLVLLGDRIDRWPVLRRRPAAGGHAPFWGRVAAEVMRRPFRSAVPVILFLIALAMPFTHIKFGIADDRVLPKDAESRVVADALRTEFAGTGSGATVIVADGWGTGTNGIKRAAVYAARLSRVEGVSRVDSMAGTFVHGVATPKLITMHPRTYASGKLATYFSVLTDVEPYSDAGADLARAIRAVPVPAGVPVMATGPAAQLVDITASIGGRLPHALILIACTTFALLFLLTGSVLLPLKALVFNLLTMSSVFGVAVWIFQDGNLSEVLGFTATPLTVAIPVLLFCVAFGLSMDYEVFVLSRIIERHRQGADLRTAVVEGLSRSGRVISAAAAILSVSFLAMLVSGVSFIQFFGLCAALAIILDALLVRPVLVPAFMRLLGRWNWWAPGPLRALHARMGLREHG
ncbi:putative integral membrane protein [Actinoplanes missouriensis 431]|uniref:Putative integral membrane protein n=1 Tax=Actinoplanes missouriensis (strain ATCC 14538 / DSM 43046 / CBS 188.64 / JCM 3121 / NBRC 102363 / NCIMB 12654 / NRRL B-3342 / UNCC 431) TaxID=512565 RepID=I0HFX1_ACTM4|nr:MMPL family transporter [Actinoplanes missouriensis]BAL91908.1 putative integral membrane protein [Actinoplanes missouriensis 431]